MCGTTVYGKKYRLAVGEKRFIIVLPAFLIRFCSFFNFIHFIRLDKVVAHRLTNLVWMEISLFSDHIYS